MKKQLGLLRIKIAEWVFNRFLSPFERAVIARKVMMQFGDDGTVKAQFEQRYGIDQVRRSPEQWKNLVSDYGMERVCKIENMSEEAVKRKAMKFSDRLEHDYKMKRV
jgi:hypothetical protein